MSYCVNCGVELASSEKECPLCGTAVVNPSGGEEEPRYQYPRRPVYGESKTGHFLIAPIGLLMLIPVAVTLLCDLLPDLRISWSVYVAAAAGLAYGFIIIAILFNGRSPFEYVPCGVLVLSAFLLTINIMTRGRWFFPFAAAQCLSLGAILTAIIEVFRREKRILPRLAAVFFGLGAVCFATDMMISFFILKDNMPTWSLYALSPCVILGVLCLITNKSARLKDELRKRFFI